MMFGAISGSTVRLNLYRRRDGADEGAAAKGYDRGFAAAVNIASAPTRY